MRKGHTPMIVSQDFLSKVRLYFSLNLYEVRIWISLLSRGTSTAGELSDIANVPRSRSYDILESLERKGFIVQKMGKPIKYMALPPEEVVDRVRKTMTIDTEKLTKRLDSLRESDILKELSMLHSQGVEMIEPHEMAGSIRGRHNLYNHMELVLRNAEESITMMTTTTDLMRNVEVFKPLFQKLRKRGVKIRIAAPITKECENVIKDLKDVAEVRHTESSARFCIIDGKEITFMVLDDKTIHPAYDIGIWVNTPFFASALEQMFELAWQTMKPATQVVKVSA